MVLLTQTETKGRWVQRNGRKVLFINLTVFPPKRIIALLLGSRGSEVEEGWC